MISHKRVYTASASADRNRRPSVTYHGGKVLSTKLLYTSNKNTNTHNKEKK